MSTKRKQQVRVGDLRVTIFPWVHPGTKRKGWRFGWLDGERWRYKTCGVLEDAKVAAEKMLREKAMGGVVWSGLSEGRRRFLSDVARLVRPGDEAEVLAFLESRERSVEVGEAVRRFVAWKVVEAGEETPHLTTVRKALEGMAESFVGRSVASIEGGELARWWEERGKDCGAKRRKDLRAAAVAFWKWAKREGVVGDGVTVAERLPTPKVAAGKRVVLSAKELLAVLAEVRREWRAWVVLGAFCGLRPEEICPAVTKREAKRGLRCEEIDWEFGVVRVAAEVSKVNRPRIVPLCEAGKVWLRWAGIEPGMSGPVCLRNPALWQESLRIAKVVWPDGKWPQDALRHSFGSYRNAVLRNLGQVAEEMGTSETMLHRHYHNPRTKEEGVEWFSVRPEMLAGGVPNGSDERRVGGGDSRGVGSGEGVKTRGNARKAR
jgi:integrase